MKIKKNIFLNKMMVVCFFLLMVINSVVCQEISNKNTKKEVKLGAYYFDGWSGLTNYTHITKSLIDEYKEREPIWGWITSTADIVKAQIDVAADAGIDFFSFCWYYTKNANTYAPLNRALNFFLDSENNQRMEFNLMVANRIPACAIGPQNWEDVTTLWINLMKHPQYLKSEGKPLITFFLLSSLIENFGSTFNVRSALEQFRDKAKKAGLKGVAIAACVGLSEIKTAQEAGIDVLTAYNNHACGVDGDKVELPMSRLISKQEKVWNSFLNCGIPYVPAITLNWDPRPWEENKKKNPNFKMYYYVPYNTETVQEVVSRGIRWVKAHPESTTKEKIITMFAWNENGEGGWLTPTKIGGDYLLKGVTKALLER